MRHPFHGVIGPVASTSIPAVQEQPRAIARRGFFGQALAALAGAGAFLFARAAGAQTGWDAGRGIGFPEGGALQGGYGGGIKSPSSGGGTGGGTVTTFALGEEGGGHVTTYALGEEGGYSPRPWRRPPGPITTYALGEEGAYYPPPRYTTYALGEEGGGYYYRRW